LQRIFQGLRNQISARNPMALKLQAFYLEVLGKDYSSVKAEPQIEQIFDLQLSNPLQTSSQSGKIIKRGLVYPLLAHQEQAHRLFRKEAMGAKRARYEASIGAFGIFHASTWLQTTSQGPQGKWIVFYSEGQANLPKEALQEGSPQWQEISKELMAHTGVSYAALTPDIEWLTGPEEFVLAHFLHRA